MWSTAEASERAWSADPIRPTDVLYEFDGPLTFIALFGPFRAFFHKIGQRKQVHFFCVSEISSHQLKSLQQGTLSVRGALSSDRLWIVETDINLVVSRYWTTGIGEMPEKLLPQRGVGLYSHFGRCPDLIEQTDAFFSMSYLGPRLKAAGTPFTIFRQIVDASYNAARRVLSPLEFAGARSSTYDFPARAIPGSLVVVLDAPRLGQDQLQRRMKGQNATVENARQIFSYQREVFFDEVDELLIEASKGEVRNSFAEERFSLLDNLQYIIPSEENEIASVEFTAPEANSIRSVVVEEKPGTELFRALKRVEKSTITDIGKIEIVNTASKTFVYRSTRGRSVTCYMDIEVFDSLEHIGVISTGVGLKVRGVLTRRQRRDSIVAESTPDFFADRQSKPDGM